MTGIAEAVFARALSGSVAQRKVSTDLAAGQLGERPADAAQFTEDVRQALYASKIVAYSQGFNQIQAGSAEYSWDVTPGDLATIWRGGCIIRAKFLDRIKDAFGTDPHLVAHPGSAGLLRRAHLRAGGHAGPVPHAVERRPQRSVGVAHRFWR